VKASKFFSMEYRYTSGDNFPGWQQVPIPGFGAFLAVLTDFAATGKN
jgi:hypothetical protein